MKKWLRGLLIVIALVGFGQVAFAIEAPDQPKSLIPTFEELKIQTPVKNIEKTVVSSPKEVGQQATKKIEKVKVEIQKSLEGSCKLWWQFALISAVFLSVFAVFAKTRPEYFPGNWRFGVYLVPLVVGYGTWILHDYYHFHVKKYELSFLCFNYWMIAGFLFFYFLMIYLLVFGFKDSKAQKRNTKNNNDKTRKTPQNKTKKKLKKPAKTFDKDDAV
ncbi:MAG: hypothetical protein WCI63_01955 [bacterium]